jgi:CelD/BcsL family acetyltransferase involved in cellulose biosynthesis
MPGAMPTLVVGMLGTRPIRNMPTASVGMAPGTRLIIPLSIPPLTINPFPMHLVRFNTLEELQPYTQAWDRLAAGVPFRSWAWLSTWWRHYGGESNLPRNRELFVLAVFDDGDMLVGLAPWFLQSTAAFGSIVRMLGSGKVSSDYLTLLSSRGMEEAVAEIVADYLTAASGNARADHRPWDQIELTGVDYEDRPTAFLAAALRRRGCTIHRRSTVNCWRIELPADWEEYLSRLSKKFRQEVRRLERNYFDSGRAVVQRVVKLADLPQNLDLLAELHQRRRRSLGEAGCYDSPQFAAFIGEVSPLLLRQGQLQLKRLEIDGQSVAAEYQLTGGGVVYAYQPGIDTEAIAHQPGKLMNIAAIRRAIAQGHRSYDFLRGDEPYKAHFRAVGRPSMEIRIIPGRPTAQLRHKLWLTGSSVKRWLKGARK